MTTTSGHTSAIRARRVIGTTVKNTAGQKIGEVEDIVLDKTSNNIMFAVVGFGGFLGLNEKFHPIPWSALDYVESEGSYVVPFTKEQLQAAPADSLDMLTRSDGAAMMAKRVLDYYRTKPMSH
jgi:sporulation protein YlmC with PRC-barrel domain